MASNGRYGREPKGVRRQFTLRVPQEHFELYEEEARRHGLPLTDYLAAVLARGHRLEEPAYLHRQSGRDVLPLTG